jgi:acyl-CoA thioesterase
MKTQVREAIFRAVSTEPLARLLDIRLKTLDEGRSLVEMLYKPEVMDNIYQRAHGGAIYALIDEAFETASQTDGTIAVALNVNVTYVTSPTPGSRLQAECNRVSQTRKTAAYAIQVHENGKRLIATCQALAYRTGKPIPFVP